MEATQLLLPVSNHKKPKVMEYAVAVAAPDDGGGAAVALEQQVGTEAEAVVEAKLGVIVPGKSITLNQIQRDRITKIATANWSVTRNGNASVAFNAQLVVDIYRTELTVSAPLQRVMVLEISQYLENYLWPHFDPLTATFEHVMSIILMVNEKVTDLSHMIFYHCYQRNL
jgi:intron-binding protein aquarius